MSKVQQDHWPRNISQYVPSMEFAADVVNGMHMVKLGSPAAADADGIWDGVSATGSATSYTSADYKSTFDGSSTSLTSTSGMIDAEYGRCLQVVGSAGSNHVVTISGKDYLGQAMSEAFTLSGTTVQYGDKAFKFVETMAIAAGASSDTCDVGWTDRLGLPYAAHSLVTWLEDNVRKDIGTYQIPVDIVDAVSADTVFGMSSEAGFVTRMDTVTTVALGSGDAAFTVEIGGTAVLGLSVTVASSGSAIGVIDGDAAGDDHGTTTKIGANAQIEVVGDGGSASNGTVDCRITVEKSVFFTDADDTTATTTTGDSRGTVQPHSACDGSIDFECWYMVDRSDMHGVAQA